MEEQRFNKNTNWKVKCERMDTIKRDKSTDGDNPVIFNTDTKQYEGWNGTEWVSLAGGGSGPGESLWERSAGTNSLVPKDSNSVASGQFSIAEGFGTKANGDYSRTGGRSTTVEVSAEGGIAEGEDTITRGKGARSGGIESEANGDSSVADGDNVIAQSYGETVVGTYNKLDETFNPTVSVPEDKAFSVGVGQFGDEKNGIVIRKNGIVTIPTQTPQQYDDDVTGKILVTKEVLENTIITPPDLAQLIKETTTYGHLGITNDNPLVTQSIVPILADSWDFDLLLDGTYELSVAVEWNLDNPNRDAVFRVDVNGVQGISVNQEPKDATNRLFLTSFVLADLSQGLNTIELFVNKELENNNILTIYGTRFTARKIQQIS